MMKKTSTNAKAGKKTVRTLRTLDAKALDGVKGGYDLDGVYYKPRFTIVDYGS